MQSPLIVDVWHNILWSSYKGEVFSALYDLARKDETFDIRFIQKAETNSERANLVAIDYARHRYPYDLLFRGSLEQVGVWRRIAKIIARTLASKASLSVLIEYEKPEFWIQYALLRLMGRKVAIFCDSTAYDRPSGRLINAIKKFLFGTVDGIFGYGQRTKEYVTSFGASPEHVFIPCQAAAMPRDYDPQSALEQRLTNAPSQDAPRFLYVGRLAPEKNLALLLTTFAKVRQNIPKATLVMVGGGALKETLAGKARSLGLDPEAILVGSKSGTELFVEYAKATCLVLPSLSEPWGLVVNEALAYGCPVVVSDRCGCIPELVMEGRTGYTFGAEDAMGLADKMIAASEHFSDVARTAKECMTLVSSFTPREAASHIHNGMSSLLDGGDKEA